MHVSTAEQFAELAGHLDLVPPSILEETCREVGGTHRPAADLGAALVRRELLTGYQVERLLRGEKRGFFFGRAKILYQIGAGSFARVFRAEDRDTGRVVAVKVLRARYGGDPDKTKLFRHEGELGRLLRHPNIVAIEDVGEEHGSSYITMEFVEGQTLRELVRIRGAVDLPRALDMILQMSAGIEYAHRRGVTHRDMKPSNVIISSAGVAKLVDFGLAGVDQSGDRALGRMETPRTIDYVALEKATGIRDDSFRSDIYFLGTVAYLALCGVSPLAESRDRSVRSDPRRFTVVQPLQSRAPDLPREVADLVSRMMHLDPLERWQTAGDLRRAVEQVIARRSTSAAVADRGQAATEERVAVRGTVMIVEAAARQQPLRDFFARLGYRVLATENPQRALGRFATTPLPADCLVMSTATLGRQALDAFNTLSTDPFYTAVPAVLVAGSQQADVAELAKVDRLRRVVQMPVQPSEMKLLLAELLTPDAGSAPAG